MKRVSIIISNRNDVAMLIVTIRSCIEELKVLGLNSAEIIICDNSDPEYYERLKSALPTGYCKNGLLKIIRQNFPCLFTARETAAKASSSNLILCIDSHMLIGHNMILDLVNFMESRCEDETIGFAHAPINWAHQHESNSRHDRDMSINELGNWGLAYDYPRTITWKGMPWICRREWFLDKVDGLGGYGALSEHKLSWGGGDLHIGIKPWLLGFKNWAVSTSPGIHIGPFPNIDVDKKNPNVVTLNSRTKERYRVWSSSGIGPHAIGFLVSCYVLGGEAMMNRNKSAIHERFGKFINLNEWWESAKELGKNEKEWLDSRKIMTFDQLLVEKPWDSDAGQGNIQLLAV